MSNSSNKIIFYKSNWIKIEGEIFETNFQHIQFSLVPPYSCEIILKFDLIKNPTYEVFFQNLCSSSRKFDACNSRIQMIGNHIKMFAIDEKQMEISLICDRFIDIDVSKLRIELIDHILNKEDEK